jgi:pilus assembly protein CpaE
MRRPTALSEVVNLDVPVKTEIYNNERKGAPNGGQPVLSVAVVDPIVERRNAVASVVCGVHSNNVMPRVTGLREVADFELMGSRNFDVVLLAVDGDRETALKTIEAICRGGFTTPIAYSKASNDDLLIRCMRAGLREFLVYPFAPGVVEEALSRVQGLDRVVPDRRIVAGKSFVFLGAKGGSGATTAACNFAISLAQESERSTLLLDLDLPLGDAALNLGITSEFSTVDALKDPERLDSRFLQELSTLHRSGLFVLGTPGRFFRSKVTNAAIDKLVAVASRTFEYVVVDAGSRWELSQTHLFDQASAIYLVTQVGIAELRNANRLITVCLQPYSSKLEIVLNRYKPEMFGIGAEYIDSALTRDAQWRIPNDYPAVREMQDTAVPFALKESDIQRSILGMARMASGLPSEQKKKKFNLFGTASRA